MRLLEEDSDDLIFPILELRAFKGAMEAVDAVAERRMEAKDLPMDDPMVQLIYEIEFKEAAETMKAARKARVAEPGEIAES